MGTRWTENVVVCSVVDWSYVTGSLAVTVHVEFEVRWILQGPPDPYDLTAQPGTKVPVYVFSFAWRLGSKLKLHWRTGRLWTFYELVAWNTCRENRELSFREWATWTDVMVLT